MLIEDPIIFPTATVDGVAVCHGHLSHTKVSEPFAIHSVLSFFLKKALSDF